ncbi:MAG: P1 family peptidase, partial [Candidatus Zixiibacteriota bacterium]
AVLPHTGNIFREKVPAAIYVGNGYGKLAGYTQVEELGNVETPIILTNTLSVGTAVNATVRYILNLAGNEDVKSVNAVVGETNDGHLNDIRGGHVKEQDVLEAIAGAKSGPVEEGNVGAGTGTRVFGFKGGIGTASRMVPIDSVGSYVLGVLVQTNFGGTLDVNGAPVGRELRRSNQDTETVAGEDGSCMIVVATDAPLSSRNLKRLAGRALHGLARTGSSMSNGSGDYVIAFSTAYRIPHGSKETVPVPPLLPNGAMSPFFRAVSEATQEAIYNSMFMAETMEGYGGHIVPAIPVDKVIEICRNYNVLHLQKKLD